MTDIIDARNLQCPEPVIKVKDKLNNSFVGKFQIMVDNEAAKENVIRFAKSNGCYTKCSTLDTKNFKIEIEKKDSKDCEIINENKAKKVIFASSDCIGSDKELGKMLMTGFLKNLVEVKKDILPEKIIFVNEGVNVTCFNKDAIDSLEKLEQMGVEVYSCGACLQYYDIEDKLMVGKVGNAYDVAVSLLKGDSVINLC